MKQAEYMYDTQIPAIEQIIATFMKSVDLRRNLIGHEHQVSLIFYIALLRDTFCSYARMWCC
jgi:hypothetical protein